MLRSRDWYAPFRTRVCWRQRPRRWHATRGVLTITSTVSYRFSTLPSSSSTGTAEIPCSENMCTTSNTVVPRLAVAMG